MPDETTYVPEAGNAAPRGKPRRTPDGVTLPQAGNARVRTTVTAPAPAGFPDDFLNARYRSALTAAGYSSVSQVQALDDDTLRGVSGIGDSALEGIRSYAARGE